MPRPSRTGRVLHFARMTPTLTLPRPDDWHVHLRDDAMLAAVIADTADNFARAIVMPNLNPPVTTGELARAYRERILSVTPEGSDFEPLMTCYLTDNTDGEALVAAHAAGAVDRGQALPCRSDHQLRCRGHRYRAPRTGCSPRWQPVTCHC